MARSRRRSLGANGRYPVMQAEVRGSPLGSWAETRLERVARQYKRCRVTGI
jgi:hypothetical protein